MAKFNAAFRKWFGDSKVVDESGSPLVVYHGTNAKFKKFDRSKLGRITDQSAESPAAAETSHIGFWFNSQPMTGKGEYTRDVSAYLKIENPNLDFFDLEELIDYFESNDDSGEEFAARLEGEGYDGLILNDTEYGGRSFVVLRPSQIKSVSSNPQITAGEKGFCFLNARKWASDHDAVKPLVVHGKVTNAEGRTLDHAWVEFEGQVADPTQGVTMPANEWYALVQAVPEAKYTPRQAIRMMVQTGKHGPWTQAEQDKIGEFTWRADDPNIGSNPEDDDDAAEYWLELVDEASISILNEWMKAKKKPVKKRGTQRWEVVPQERLVRVWKSFGKHGFVRDEEALEEIKLQVLLNTAKLAVNTSLLGHTSDDPVYLLERVLDAKPEEAEKILEGFEDFCIAENGQWRISDQIDHIVERAFKVIEATNPSEKLAAIDQLLHYSHQRTDLTASFVEGGSSTMDELYIQKSSNPASFWAAHGRRR